MCLSVCPLRKFLAFLTSIRKVPLAGGFSRSLKTIGTVSERVEGSVTLNFQVNIEKFFRLSPFRKIYFGKGVSGGADYDSSSCRTIGGFRFPGKTGFV